MKRLIFLLPASLLANVPQGYDSTNDLRALSTISSNISVIQTALNKAIAKLQDCDKANQANIKEIGKTSDAIAAAAKSFDDVVKLANQASDLVDDMTKRSA
ncbi:hypothetical protein A3F66_03900 [candidate division TM6 bacterium RIFCSPHIGHO2_12_FULL_32_22]|nr:MAG: hypothetical protein A3F66_03900 [candidate division TM6 bacterium RIFCSPHIGHO2_12_FULL_32_22]